MTNGQIQQLRDLSKCYGLPRYDRQWVVASLSPFFQDDHFTAAEKAWLRRLTHQYRNQIRAMERNR